MSASLLATNATALQELVQLHRDARIDGYGAVAAYTWLALDYIMMLPTEVQYVWNAKWNISKLLFLWIRLYGTVLLMVNAVVAMTGGHSSQSSLILQLRIYAIYNRNRRLAIVNAVFFFLENLSSAIVFNYNVAGGTILATPPGVIGCYGILSSSVFSIWLPALAFELWLVFLAMWKAYQRHREQIVVNGRRLDLLSVLIRDNVIYFVVIALGLLINAIIWFAAPSGLAPAAVALSQTSMIISGSRLFLNLFEAYGRSLRSGVFTTTGVSTTQQQSTLVFNYIMPHGAFSQRSRWTDMGALAGDLVAVDYAPDDHSETV
ncbi:hypothetical protein OH77DRAFT_1515869 [Trametes cingulata]|nr:hypothetical protein OH77DRAFT_1515869 [Trametes cingulata]